MGMTETRLWVHYTVTMVLKDNGEHRYIAEINPMQPDEGTKAPQHITGESYSLFLQKVTQVEMKYKICTVMDY